MLKYVKYALFSGRKHSSKVIVVVMHGFLISISWYTDSMNLEKVYATQFPYE